MKTITMQPWQLAALQAGRLKSVWVPLDIPEGWECTFRLPKSVITTSATGTHFRVIGLPYAVGDVVEIEDRDGYVLIDARTLCGGYGGPIRRTITAVSIRRVDSITEQEARDAGLKDGLDAFYHQTSGQWAVKVDLEAQT